MDLKYGTVFTGQLGDTFLDDLDPETQRLFINFLMSIGISLSLILVWFLLRKIRGDKKDITRHGSEVSEVKFDHNFSEGRQGRLFSKAAPRMTKKGIVGAKITSTSGSSKVS
jgi:hypothetical protein